MIRNIVGVLAGVIIVVILDLMISRFVTSSLTIGISASVLAGALVASLIVEKHEWIFGLLVGIINCFITLILFFYFTEQALLNEHGYSMSDVVARPMLLSIVFSIIGGVLSMALKLLMRKNKGKINV